MARRAPIGAARSHRKLVGWRQLPREPRAGRVPEWPLSAPTKAELAKWRKMWRTMPQAHAWAEDHSEDLVGLYVRAFVRVARPGGMTARMMAELRQLDSKIGVSPRALHALRWAVTAVPRVVQPEDVERKVVDFRARVPARDEA